MDFFKDYILEELIFHRETSQPLNLLVEDITDSFNEAIDIFCSVNLFQGKQIHFDNYRKSDI